MAIKAKQLSGVRVYNVAGRVPSAKINTIITWQDIVNAAMNPVVIYLKNKRNASLITSTPLPASSELEKKRDTSS